MTTPATATNTGQSKTFKETHVTTRTRKALTAIALTLAAIAASGGMTGSAQAAPVFDVSIANSGYEIQMLTVRATSGQYKLKYGDGGPGVAETTDLPYNATGNQVQAALNALTNINAGGGSVTVLGRAENAVTTNYRISFDGGPLAQANAPTLKALKGTTPLTSPFPDKTIIQTIDTPGIYRNEQRVDYAVAVRNTAGTAPGVGDQLFCNGIETSPALPKNWFPASPGSPVFPTFGFTWLRNGVVIGGQTLQTYTAGAGDAGAVVQCLVTGTNPNAAAVFASRPMVVNPVPATAPPASPGHPLGASRPVITGSGAVGVERTCAKPVLWPADTPATFQWLVNATPIVGATTSSYTPVAADDAKNLQCRATGTNAGGTVVSISDNNLVGTVTQPPSLPEAQTPDVVFDSSTSGPVTVEVELPGGLETRAVDFFGPDPAQDPFGPPRTDTGASESGWSCTAQPAVGLVPAKAICTRSDPLGPQQAYPKIGIAVAIGSDMPSPAVATATASGGGGIADSAQDEFSFASAMPFGITPGTFMTEVLDSAGDEFVQAGGHPYAVRTTVAINHRRRLGGSELSSPNAFRQVAYARNDPVELMKHVRADAPRGFVGNPLVPPVVCEDPQLILESACPLGSVVGEVALSTSATGNAIVGPHFGYKALVAIKPERGEVAQFAFGEEFTKGLYVLNARLRPEDGYAVTVEAAPIVQDPPLIAVGATFCGYGADAVLLPQQVKLLGCKQPGDPGAYDAPLFTMPTECSGESLQTRISIDSWDNPGVFMSAVADEPLIEGCEDVPFTPSVAMSPTSSTADSSSGLDASIDVPSDGLLDHEGIAQSHLKKTVVELPEGVSVNPSAATGLQGCTDAQLGLGTDSEPSCPDGSKLGTVEATTPVLEETLSGVMVLRAPKSTDPASGDMLRVALIVRNDERGVLVKLPGSATADPQTGRLTATFDDNPQLPIGHVEVHLRGGDKGVLAMGRDCGEVSTKATLTPWSGNADAVSDTPLDVDQRCGDGFAPKLSAGNSDNKARGQGGTYSFEFSREDGEQWLRGLTAKLPKGLLASVKDVPLCSSQAADAGNCPAASKIGVVDAKAGSGDPFVLEEKGEVFLTEGYKGGEYGLVVKVRPVAGPFRGQYELSPIVVRQAIHVDRSTAEVTAVSDPFPLVHHGIPLRVREVNVLVNRGGFMLNPSDCTQKQSSAQLLSDEGTTAGFSDPFQVSGCAALPFKPKLTLALTGKRQVTTGKHPGVKAVVTQQGTSEAGVEQAVVRLPKSLALDPNNAQALCEFVDGTKADLENRCPKGSIVGRARAKTPLLKDDLVGNVYFVKNVRRDPTTGNEIRTLPMIVVALRGEISINLKGESSTTKAGKLVNTFASVPDAPITQFNLNIKGGANGILAVTRTRKARINLCAGRHTAEADIDGHNGRQHDTDIRMKTPCTKKQAARAKRAARSQR